MSQIKIQVLAIGDLQSGEGRGGAWHRRTLQCFEPNSQVVGNHAVYGDKEELEIMKKGVYMFNLQARAGDRGRLDFVLTDGKQEQTPQAQR